MIEKLGLTPTWQAARIDNIDELKVGQLHVWWVPLQLSSTQKPIAESLLSELQRDKYARRATPELQHAYLAGRFYLLNLLAAYAGIKPKQVDLCYSRLNKPSLRHDNRNIEFNFTDTTIDGVTHGVFAFTKAQQVGVDVEARGRRSNFSAIAKKKFTENEIKFVAQANSTQPDPERFLAIWTRKEAFGKATGLGINFQMNQRDLASETPELNFFDQGHQAWRLLQLELGDQLIASVVHAGHSTLDLKAYQLQSDNELS